MTWLDVVPWASGSLVGLAGVAYGAYYKWKARLLQETLAGQLQLTATWAATASRAWTVARNAEGALSRAQARERESDVETVEKARGDSAVAAELLRNVSGHGVRGEGPIRPGGDEHLSPGPGTGATRSDR